jgi:hypothetical protein
MWIVLRAVGEDEDEDDDDDRNRPKDDGFPEAPLLNKVRGSENALLPRQRHPPTGP